MEAKLKQLAKNSCAIYYTRTWYALHRLHLASRGSHMLEGNGVRRHCACGLRFTIPHVLC